MTWHSPVFGLTRRARGQSSLFTLAFMMVVAEIIPKRQRIALNQPKGGEADQPERKMEYSP
jgi:hypothetical protein